MANWVDGGYGNFDMGQAGVSDWTGNGQYKPYGWVNGQWKGLPTFTVDPSDQTISPEVKAYLYRTGDTTSQYNAYQKRTGVPAGTYQTPAYQAPSWSGMLAGGQQAQGQQAPQVMYQGPQGGGYMPQMSYPQGGNSYLKDVGGTMQRQVSGAPVAAQIPGQTQQTAQTNPNNVSGTNPSWTNSRPNSWWGFRTDFIPQQQQTGVGNWYSRQPGAIGNPGYPTWNTGTPAAAGNTGGTTNWYANKGGISNPTYPNYGGTPAASQATGNQATSWYQNKPGAIGNPSSGYTGNPQYFGGMLGMRY